MEYNTEEQDSLLEHASKHVLDEDGRSADTTAHTDAAHHLANEGAGQSYTRHPRRTLILALLVAINLLNYLDRYSISGVLPLLTDKSKSHLDRNLSNGDGGLLTTLFIVAYIIFSPIFGYLGDRTNRKILICIGIVFWSIFTFGGSFSTTFVELLLSRSMVGIGEASYATIAPTIIADLYEPQIRTMMLSVFYLAIPVGAALGYLVGSSLAELLGSWRWAFRISPGIGIVLAVLYYFLTTDPQRGANEGLAMGHATANQHSGIKAMLKDVKYVVRVRAFLWSTLGFTAVTFSTGALAAWAPTFVYRQSQQYKHPYSSSDASFIFGAITCVTGIAGTLAGSSLSKYLERFTPRHDSYVCGVSMLVAVIFMAFSLPLTDYNMGAFWFLVFLGELALCFNWALTAAITLYVVVPERRATAEAVNILTTHLLGDAASPYITGLISDTLHEKYNYTEGDSMMLALFLSVFIAFLGGLCFLQSAKYVAEDRAAASAASERLKTRQINFDGGDAEQSEEADSDMEEY